MQSFFFLLVRWPNILIIILTQYFCRYFILRPLLELNKLPFFLSDLHFFLLVFSTVVIAGGGYLINDYFDLKGDEMNGKSEKGIFIKKNRTAILWAHHVLSAIGIVVGFYLAYIVNNITLGFVFFLVVTLLWYYSISYKGKAVIGNFIVAFLSATTIIIVWLFVFYAFQNSSVQIRFNNWFLELITGYIIFAFGFSFLREIIKDMEDVKGDQLMQKNTLPVICGIKKTKIITYILMLFVAFFLYRVEIWLYKLEIKNVLYYFAGVINVLFILSIVLLIVAKSSKDFSRAQWAIKIIMLAGVFSMIFIPAYAQKFIL